MKFYERSLQALLFSAPRGFAAHSRVLARVASLAQIGELARRLVFFFVNKHNNTTTKPQAKNDFQSYHRRELNSS